MREVIAVQACLPVLNLGLEKRQRRVEDRSRRAPSVSSRNRRSSTRQRVAHEWVDQDSLLGQSCDSGPVVLSWKDVEASGWGDGYNVIIHEAAHRLDLLDGEMNGRPALHEGMDPAEWLAVFSGCLGT